MIERFALAAQGVALRLRRWTGGRGRRGDFDERILDEIRLPVSPFGREVRERAEAVLPGWLLQHSLRAYVWGSLLARVEGVTCDAELFFAGCALHDLGLCPECANPAEVCFGLRGAEAAIEIVRTSGGSAAQAALVGDAIALHLNVRVGLQHGPEAHFLHAGTALDVIGARASALPPGVRAEVVRRHPRQEMKREFCQVLRREAGQAPDTRMGFYVGSLGFLERLAAAPFPE